MCFLASPTDDAPELQPTDIAVSHACLERDRAWMDLTADNVRRMVEACRAGDPSYTPPVIAMTMNLLHNAVESYVRTHRAVHAEPLPPLSQPHSVREFGRRSVAGVRAF